MSNLPVLPKDETEGEVERVENFECVFDDSTFIVSIYSRGPEDLMLTMTDQREKRVYQADWMNTTPTSVFQTSTLKEAILAGLTDSAEAKAVVTSFRYDREALENGIQLDLEFRYFAVFPMKISLPLMRENETVVLARRIRDLENRVEVLEKETQTTCQDGLEWESLSGYLKTGWTPFDEGNWQPRVCKDPFGIVHFMGLIRYGTHADGTLVMLLPPQFRPARDTQCAVVSMGPATIRMLYFKPNGGVHFYNGPSGTAQEYLCLGAISYPSKLRP